MMPLGYKLGLVSDTRWQRYQEVQKVMEREMHFLEKNNTTINDQLSEPTRLVNLLKRPQMEFADLQKYGYTIPEDITPDIANRILLKVKYAGYFKRQMRDIDRFYKMEQSELPTNLDYMKMESIAWEAREKLNKVKPLSIGQAARIPGVNITDINALIIYLKKIAKEHR